MNVIYGENEAGKSSWHGALYAGLCGIRRRQGRAEPADQLFTDRHRPWHDNGNGEWAVTVVLELPDGKQLELRHDLATRTATITDRTFGRPYPGDITHDGAPDGARLLGLDRRAFLATACVRQADLLAVRDSSAQLQEYLQKAVATGRDDATVIGALKAIDRYRDDFVGTDRTNSGKPWRAAIDAVTRCERELNEATRQHENYLGLVARAEELRDQADTAHNRLALVVARQAEIDADRLHDRLLRARALGERFPSDPPPASLGDEALANLVAGTLAAWTARPAESKLSGRSATDLRAQLDALPQIPQGDLQPDRAAESAHVVLRDALRAIQQHAELEPGIVEMPDGRGLSEDDLRSLAFDLRRERVKVDPAAEERLRQAQEALDAVGRRAPSKVPLIAGAVLGGVGLALALGTPFIGGLLLSASAVLIVIWLISKREQGSSGVLLADLDDAERRLVEQQMRAEESIRVQEAATERAQSIGLIVDAAALETLAANIATAHLRQQEKETWSRRHYELEAALNQADETLRAALQARGVEPHNDLLADFEHYERRCRDRAAIAEEARRGPQLAEQLLGRQTAEEVAADVMARRLQATDGVLQAAAECSIVAETPEQAVNLLGLWQDDRGRRLTELEEQRTGWTELQRLLDGGPIEQLEVQAGELRAQAEKHAASLSADDIRAVTLQPDPITQIEELRQAYEDQDREHERLKGRIQTEATRLLSVPAAVEALDAAKRELERVERLRETLNLTKALLETAQDRVHRDIAPVLGESVTRWLPQVTRGRYREVTVDPQDLNVRVRLANGTLQSAHLLSHGTAEQIYLLLRVAMAERLTKQDEVCPLILDDVTAQSDGRRTVAILDALHVISAERQIILFTQEQEVLTWAESHLIGNDRDLLNRLPSPESAA